MSEFETAKVGETDDMMMIEKFRRWFRVAVDKAGTWRKEAREDYEFVAGKQWKDGDRTALERSGRPAITINKIKPLVNVLSGYQRLNRYDIDFLPRTNDDMQLCNVRKGVTKYVMDRCDYEYHESQVFLDGAVCGVGWFEVRYHFDEETGDGEAEILHESPFNIYVDPEARKPDYSDAKYIIRARWVDKEELISVYPDHQAEILFQMKEYDDAEKQDEYEGMEPLWYQREKKKIRIVECWYKTKVKETFYLLSDGRTVTKAEITPENIMMIEGAHTARINQIRVCAFFDHVLLEDVKSPYEHGEFPFVPFVAYHFGEGDIPAGIVRDLKDPQKEINKRRSQMLHILNTASNSGWIAEEDAITPEQEMHMRNMGARPGVVLKVRTGSMGRIQRLEPSQPPVALIQAEQESAADLPAISGINEALMGTDIPNSASGRAIEMKQKQAITHIAPLFDNLRKAKKKIASLLWGRRGHKGIIPQYYTEEKVYRVEGPNGMDFIHVNQQVQQQDPLRGVIHTTMNDLSQGEFDIIIADTQASATQRQAQMWSLIDAVSKLGVPGDMVFDLIIDLSDIPNKEDVKQRWTERQKAQQQQQQAAAQAEQQKQIRMSNSIAFKDAPLPIQLAMAAKAGLIDERIANYVVQQYVQAYFPQLAQQLATQPMQQQVPQGIPEQAMQPQQQNQSPMTQAAMQSLLAGLSPAAM